MLIGTRPKTKNINLAIYIDNIRITQETSIKLLGVEVDANLTWNTHISTLAKKISSKIGLVKRLQQFLPSNTVLSLYPPIIQSHIDYGLTLWGNSSLKNLKVIQRLQNRAARVFSKNYDYNVSGESLVKRLGWMSVSERYKYLSCCLIFKCLFDSNIYNSSDDTFITNYKFTHETHQYKTRNNLHKCLAIPMPRTEYYKRSLSYNGVILWNEIPSSIRNSGTLQTFKLKLKTFLK